MRNFSTCVQYTGKRTKNTREVIQAVLKDLSEQVIFKLTNKSSNKNIQRFRGKHFRYNCQYIFPKSILNIMPSILPTQVCHFQIG
jgi:hypothetical protein